MTCGQVGRRRTGALGQEERAAGREQGQQQRGCEHTPYPFEGDARPGSVGT
jgi:hypothetical protein